MFCGPLNNACTVVPGLAFGRKRRKNSHRDAHIQYGKCSTFFLSFLAAGMTHSRQLSIAKLIRILACCVILSRAIPHTQWIQVYSPGGIFTPLQISEVRVFLCGDLNLTNVALNKSSRAVTTTPWTSRDASLPNRVVDGYVSCNDSNQFSLGSDGGNPFWWGVDLGQEYDVCVVEVMQWGVANARDLQFFSSTWSSVYNQAFVTGDVTLYGGHVFTFSPTVKSKISGGCGVAGACNCLSRGTVLPLTSTFPFCGCSCSSGYSGAVCEQQASQCSFADCSNNAGNVSGTKPNCNCSCLHGYYGSRCSLQRTLSAAPTTSRSTLMSVSALYSATHSFAAATASHVSPSISISLSGVTTSSSSLSVRRVSLLLSSSSLVSASNTHSRPSMTASSQWSHLISRVALSSSPMLFLTRSFSYSISLSAGDHKFAIETASSASSFTEPMDTVSLTPLCGAPPFSVNSSLRVMNNESRCRDHVCLGSRSDVSGDSVALGVAYDEMAAAQSVLVLFAESDIQWLSLLPSVRLGTVTLDTVALDALPERTFGLAVTRPGSRWPGLEVRPYAVQRLPLVVSLHCLSANGTVVSHASEMVLVVVPRSMPVAASVQAMVQSSQAIAGGLGSGGGTEALTMGRLATSLSMLSCTDALQGYGAGLGVLSVSGDLLAAVDTIAGNLVFVAAAAVAAALVAGGLCLCASSRCSFAACCRDVLRLPLSLFTVFAATLPSTVMAVVAVLRDVPTLSGGAASGAYCLIAAAAAVWGGALVVVGAATRRMSLTATLRPTTLADTVVKEGDSTVCPTVASLRWVFGSSAVWVATRPADESLFEGTTVLWLLPLDVCTSVAMAVTSALPLSRSAALCVGSNAVNVVGCAVMLAAAALRRPFATAFGGVHSVVTYAMVLALAVCGLVVAVGRGDSHRVLVAINYLSGSAAVMCVVKAIVDVAGIVVATRRRFLTLMHSFAVSDVCGGGCGQSDGPPVTLQHENENVLKIDEGCRLQSVIDLCAENDDEALPSKTTPTSCLEFSGYHPHVLEGEVEVGEVEVCNVSGKLRDLLDAYQHTDLVGDENCFGMGRGSLSATMS